MEYTFCPVDQSDDPVERENSPVDHSDWSVEPKNPLVDHSDRPFPQKR
ncbi:hypothetical protein KJ762_08195 [bacterium]|nr:hypothetical protein [bacterium]MBU1063463.1 hypothetical protein [bacterium]MBU1634473.1 hypothetical protein [bacterium]MBU1874649.1 hypothetical protein [bacterium]